MHLIFFDESKPQPDYPFYHLGGICIDEKNTRQIELLVNELSITIFGSAILKKENEFHANDIFHRKNNFKEFNDVSKRIDVLIELINILSSDVIMPINIQINTKYLFNSEKAPFYAFMFMCERANSLMKEKDALGMLIGDRENEHMTQNYSFALSHYRYYGTTFDFKMDIDCLFESVHFTPSHLSRFLQLADAYTWICKFKNRFREPPKDKTRARIHEIINEVKLYPKRYKTWPQ